MALDKPERSSIQIIANATQINSYLASPPVIPAGQIFDRQNALGGKRDSVRRRIARPDLNQIVWLECFHQSLQDCFGWWCLEILFTISTRDLLEERNDEIKYASPEGRVHFKYSLQTGFVLRLNSKREAQGAHPDSCTLHRGFPELLSFILTEASDTVELDHVIPANPAASELVGPLLGAELVTRRGICKEYDAVRESYGCCLNQLRI